MNVFTLLAYIIEDKVINSTNEVKYNNGFYVVDNKKIIENCILPLCDNAKVDIDNCYAELQFGKNPQSGRVELQSIRLNNIFVYDVEQQIRKTLSTLYVDELYYTMCEEIIYINW